MPNTMKLFGEHQVRRPEQRVHSRGQHVPEPSQVSRGDGQ